jgi:hypothetical protein
MTDDSLQFDRTSDEPFDQDSSFTTDREGVHTGTCQECSVGQCGKCSNSDCGCLHPFVAIGRAIVELDGSICRSGQLLGQLGASPKGTEQVARSGGDEGADVTPLPVRPSKPLRGLGRRKLLG